MPTMTSYLRSANARIAGSMLTGVPGSTSRSTIPRPGLPQAAPLGSVPVSAHFMPFHAAALKERSSLPPMSKTMPASIFAGSLTAYVCGLHAESSARQASARADLKVGTTVAIADLKVGTTYETRRPLAVVVPTFRSARTVATVVVPTFRSATTVAAVVVPTFRSAFSNVIAPRR